MWHTLGYFLVDLKIKNFAVLYVWLWSRKSMHHTMCILSIFLHDLIDDRFIHVPKTWTDLSMHQRPGQIYPCTKDLDRFIHAPETWTDIFMHLRPGQIYSFTKDLDRFIHAPKCPGQIYSCTKDLDRFINAPKDLNILIHAPKTWTDLSMHQRPGQISCTKDLNRFIHAPKT